MKIKFDLPMLKTSYVEFENSILTVEGFYPADLSKEKNIISIFIGAKECAEIFFQDDASITEKYLTGVGVDSEEFTKTLLRYMYTDPAKADAVRTYLNRPFNEVIPQSEILNSYHEYHSKNAKNRSVTHLAFYENELTDFVTELESDRITNGDPLIDLIFGEDRDVARFNDFTFAINIKKFTNKIDKHLPKDLLNRVTPPTLEEKLSILLDKSEYILDDILGECFDIDVYARDVVTDASYRSYLMDQYGYLGVYGGRSPLFTEITKEIYVFVKYN